MTATQPAGWYHAEGDPVGTKRYWDGSMWVGGPTTMTAENGGGSGSAAAVGKRIGARIIDWLITAICLGIPVVIGLINHIDFDALPDPEDSELFQSEFAAQIEAFNPGVGVELVIAFFVLWEIIWLGLKGASPGKLMLGLRVQNTKTGEIGPGWVAAILRNVTRLLIILGEITGIFVLVALLATLASVVMLFADDQGRTIADRIASTIVVDKNAVAASDATGVTS